jgi:hypothetical protein
MLQAHADVKSVLPDFHAEPGLNPFRDPVQANANEVIDPFSDRLHLSHNGDIDFELDIPELTGEECTQNKPIRLDGQRKEACSVEYSPSASTATAHGGSWRWL